MARRPLWPAVLAGWGLAAAVLCLVAAPAIAGLRFADPDDAMRLLEVRDWLAGQSWWDVAQHRLNGGAFSMHWSRLVDLPLAAVIVPADPLFGVAASDRLAMTLVPLATLLAALALVASITRRVAGDEPARLSVLLVPLSAVIVFQLRPMRIDHHGWQIVLALAAVRPLLGRWSARNGAVAGLALGALVCISLEGLPIAAAIVTIAAIGWALDPRRPAFLVALGGSFAGAAALLHAVTRGPAMWSPACDALSPPWLAVLAAAAAGLALAATTSRLTLPSRLAALALGGLGCLLVLRLAAPHCLAGPFATMDPTVRALWYDQVDEGLPLWRQKPEAAALTIGLPIVGVIGVLRALADARGIARRRWALLAALLFVTAALSCLVYRVGATANALAVPGAAVLATALLHRARAVRGAVGRIVATGGVLLLISAGPVAARTAALAGGAAAPPTSATGAPGRPQCERFANIRALAQLPPTTILVPVDVTPDLIATTSHRAVAGGYHRNSAAIHRVEAAFIAPPAAARAAILASGARVLAVCPGLSEPNLYAHVAPRGLWARLERGERFDWLRPVPIRGSPVLAWRVLPSTAADR